MKYRRRKFRCCHKWFCPERYHYHTLRRRLHAYAGKAGIDIQVTPHIFRRSCTTEMRSAGEPTCTL